MSQNDTKEPFRLAAQPPPFRPLAEFRALLQEWRKVFAHIKAEKRGLQSNDLTP